MLKEMKEQVYIFPIY